MDILDILQCDSCKQNYEAFIKLQPAMTEQEQEVLKQYTVFMEMRRLKEKRGRNVNPNSTLYTLGEPNRTITLTC